MIHPTRSRGLLLAALLLLLGPFPPAYAQSAENVAVVINDNSPASQRIGEYYAKRRGLPAAHVIRIRTTPEETIERQAYIATIEQSVAAAIARDNLQDRVLYLVLTKGIPLRIAGTSGVNGLVASVDSELTLLYRRMTGGTTVTAGRLDNPYYLGNKPIEAARPFTHREHDIFLVSRLDAFTVEGALALIDKAQTPSREGRFVLDQQDKLVNRTGEDWLELAAQRLTEMDQGERVLLEKTVQGARDVSPVAGYYSWGSNDPRNRVRRFGMGFVPGSLAATFVSSDARTFREPPADWEPTSDWNDKALWFGGSPQSLIGDLIQEGATGVAGHVAEPYLQSVVRPEVLFPAYVAGFNLVEAFYLAIPHLSWQTVVIGDPLCAPYPRKLLTPADIEEGVDAATELPAAFARRQMANAKLLARGIPDKAVANVLRAARRRSQSDRAGALTSLKEAIDLAPQYVTAQLQLAVLYDEGGDYEEAIAQYRKVVALQPKNAIALNNLAFSLAVRKQALDEARTFAIRAVSLAPREPSIADTLGWIEHLMGNHASAAKILGTAARAAPLNAEIRLHSAIAQAAAGATAAAQAELNAALKLDPSFADREDVKELRKTLASAAGQR